LISLIDYPRPFIYCAGYFGPDRRRQQQPFDGPDRRRTLPDEIQVIYASRNPGPLRADGPKVWHFRPPNTLRAKIGGAAPGETGSIDPALLDMAEKHIGTMEDDYADWVRELIAELSAAVERCARRPGNAAGLFRRINSIALELRGQAGMFGYPLVTLFCESLCDYTESRGPKDHRHIELLKAHIDGISAVIRQKIKGDGGPVGAELIESLRRAQRRYEQAAD
jgi:hypothetical protein